MKKFLLFFLLLSNAAFAQNAINGIVKDSDGATVVGATVQIQGTTTYSVTDANGKFTLSAPKQFPVTIRVSSVGYKLQEVEIYELDGEELEINVIADNLLSEVVVTSR